MGRPGHGIGWMNGGIVMDGEQRGMDRGPWTMDMETEGIPSLLCLLAARLERPDHHQAGVRG